MRYGIKLPVSGNIFAIADPYFIPASSQEVAHDEQRTQLPPPEVIHSEARIPVPTAQAPEPIYITHENPTSEEMVAKYNMAQAENERLKAQIALLTAQLELRRRT